MELWKECHHSNLKKGTSIFKILTSNIVKEHLSRRDSYLDVKVDCQADQVKDGDDANSSLKKLLHQLDWHERGTLATIDLILGEPWDTH